MILPGYNKECPTLLQRAGNDLDASPRPRFCKLASTAAYGSQYAAESSPRTYHHTINFAWLQSQSKDK
jgi:hypothetical protein